MKFLEASLTINDNSILAKVYKKLHRLARTKKSITLCLTMKHKLLLIIPCLLGCFGCQFAYTQEAEVQPAGKPGEEVNSSNGGDRLLAFYERFKQSDLNSDGKLTVKEMHDFLNDMIKNGTQSDPTPSKTINFKKLKGLKSRSYLNAFYIETKGSADISGDGILTKPELLKYVLSQRKIYNEEGKQVSVTVDLEPNN